MPEPASTMMMSSLIDRISMQGVSPPYFRYSSPETGTDPLAPQHRIIIETSSVQKDNQAAVIEKVPYPAACEYPYRSGDANNNVLRF
jgi:hypothetical protein